jgi:hypothetical protein
MSYYASLMQKYSTFRDCKTCVLSYVCSTRARAGMTRAVMLGKFTTKSHVGTNIKKYCKNSKLDRSKIPFWEVILHQSYGVVCIYIKITEAAHIFGEDTTITVNNTYGAVHLPRGREGRGRRRQSDGAEARHREGR